MGDSRYYGTEERNTATIPQLLKKQRLLHFRDSDDVGITARCAQNVSVGLGRGTSYYLSPGVQNFYSRSSL